MNSGYIMLTIIGMGVVTYLPRVLPFVMFKGKELPPFIQEVLKNVPYAALGALIFPAIFFIQDGNVLFGVIGMVTAFSLSFIGANIIVVILGTIAVLSFYSAFM